MILFLKLALELDNLGFLVDNPLGFIFE